MFNLFCKRCKKWSWFYEECNKCLEAKMLESKHYYDENILVVEISEEVYKFDASKIDDSGSDTVKRALHWEDSNTLKFDIDTLYNYGKVRKQ